MRFSSGSKVAARYEVVSVLGQGAAGTVLHVVDLSLDEQSFALKVLHPELLHDDHIRKRFHNEVSFARQLVHPRIVRIYDFEQSGDITFLLMEYVAGCNLAEVLESYPGRAMPCSEALYVLRQIAEGLRFAHQKNIIHRDVKPANVLIDRHGAVKLSDFGIAHSLEASHQLTRTGQFLGTPAYMAPECFSGVCSGPATDIYSFGILAFELLSGKLPFTSEVFYELGQQHQEQELPLTMLDAHDIPPGIVELIAGCCRKKPEERLPSMGAVIAGLQQQLAKSDDQSSTILGTIIREKKPDGVLVSERTANIMALMWLLAIWLVFTLSVVYERNNRIRIDGYLQRLENVTGFSTARLRRGLGFGRCHIQQPAIIPVCVTEGTEEEFESMLLAGLPLDTRDRQGNSLMHLVVHSYIEKVNLLFTMDAPLNYRNRRGETPLFLAIKTGRLVTIGLLLGKGVNPHIPDKQGNIPLLWAVRHGDVEAVVHLIKAQQPESRIVRTVRDSEGRTALHLAAEMENPQMIELLLSNSFDVHARDLQGRSALMEIVQHQFNDRTAMVAEHLLDQGAQTNLQDNNGRTLYDLLPDGSAWQSFLQQYTPSSEQRSLSDE